MITIGQWSPTGNLAHKFELKSIKITQSNWRQASTMQYWAQKKKKWQNYEKKVNNLQK